jgi:hypothetical protein
MPAGVQPRIDSLESRNVLFTSDGRPRVTMLSRVIAGTARDAGNTPTTTIRAGTLLGRITASGKLKEYQPGASDGSQNFYGVLLDDTRVVDSNGTNQDQPGARIAVAASDVRAAQLLILGASLIGHANETATRTAMRAKFFVFDDE